MTCTFRIHPKRRAHHCPKSNVSTCLKESKVSSQPCHLAITEANPAEPVRLVVLGVLGWVDRRYHARGLNLRSDGRRSVMKISLFAKNVLNPTDLAGTGTFLISPSVMRRMQLRRKHKLLGGNEQETCPGQILAQFRRLSHLPDKPFER